MSQKSAKDRILCHLFLQQKDQAALDEQIDLSLWDAALLASFCSHIEPIEKYKKNKLANEDNF